MAIIGKIVRSLAGRDKDRYYVIVDTDVDCVWIADGDIHLLESPKRKNRKHLQSTHQQLVLNEITSNKALLKKLEPMNQSLIEGYCKKGGNATCPRQMLSKWKEQL